MTTTNTIYTTAIPTTEVIDEKCQDSEDSCSSWAETGHCTDPIYENWMLTNCKKSCHTCRKCNMDLFYILISTKLDRKIARIQVEDDGYIHSYLCQTLRQLFFRLLTGFQVLLQASVTM